MDPGVVPEINPLKTAYVVGYGADDVDGVLETFTPDATYTTFLGSFHGAEAIRKNFTTLRDRYDRTAHMVSNVTIQLTSTAAESSYVHAATQIHDGLAHTIPTITPAGRLESRQVSGVRQ
jgi:ketosteroid isomerase-like protein